MPLWTLSAFGFIKEGERLAPDDIRIKLMVYLIVKHMNKTPLQIYDVEYRHNWKTSEFVPVIKSAVKKCRENF